MVVIIRCNDVVSDPRAMKYVNYLIDSLQDFKIIGWDRDGKYNDSTDIIYYKKKARFNVGGIKAVVDRIGWMWFVLKTLFHLKHTFNKAFTIHACDLDAAFPASMFKILTIHSSRFKIIYDVFDWFSATLYNQKKYVVQAFKVMERISIKKADFIILCEKERIEQIPFKFNLSKMSILPNIPSFEKEDFLVLKDEFKFNNSLLTFAYVGSFSVNRCLEEIIELAEKGEINLLIAGFGNDNLVKRLNNTTCANIRYFGKVKYEFGLQIMYNADVIYAMYAKANPNHIYAAPNKYYEAMFLGKPIFSTIGTIVEKKIIEENIGFVSEESEIDILRVIKNISCVDIEEKGKTARTRWESKYHNFTANYLKNQYQTII